jgi:hypothetical protein
MVANFHRQAEPLRRRCLKQTLEPFSIGHAHLLGSIESPFAPDNWRPDDQKLPQLIDAAFLCARGYADARAALKSPWCKWQMLLWGRLAGKFDPYLEREILRRHIQEATAVPEIWTEGGRDLGAPTLLLLWQHLRFTRGFGEREAMDYPFGRAVWDYLGYHETKGAVQICNATEREIMESVRADRDAAAAQTGEPKPAAPQWPIEEAIDYAI